MHKLNQLLLGEAGFNRTFPNPANVIAVYSLLGFLSLVTFGLLHVFVENNPFLGYLELAGGSALAFNMLGLRVTGNVRLASVCFLFILMAMLLVMLSTGGTRGTGIFWFFLFPVAAFFLVGKREGGIWVFTLLGITTLFWALSRLDIVAMYYSDISIRQLVVSMIVVTVGVYVYERAREQSDARIKQADMAKSEFATLASHQLRTPISAINWFSEMMLSGDAGKLNREQREHVKQIYDSNQRMGSLVDAMLMVSSLELGNLPIRPERIDLAAAASRIVKEQLASAPDKQLKLKEQYGTGLPTISFDTHILKIILNNIVSNSIKYTPNQGNISIEITRTAEKLNPKSIGSVAIIVSDSGYGIPAEAKHKIFTKFFRAENIKDKDTDGTGLGLYIVKAILDYIGGRITFDSHEGKGTTFVIVLPLEGISLPERAAAEKQTA